MDFEWEYPIYCVVKGLVRKDGEVTFDDLLTLGLEMDDGQLFTAVAVFTDKPAAEEYRDGFMPGHSVVTLDVFGFRFFLEAAREVGFNLVAFDPYRVGTNVQAVPVDDILSRDG